MSQEKEIYTVEEVARRLRIGRGSAFNAVKSGEIPSIRIGRRILIPKAAIDAMLEKPSTQAEAR